MDEAMCRVTMATDVPFWHGSTGAEQRILAMANFLNRQPFELVVFYLGTLDPHDLDKLRELDIRITRYDSQRPPATFLRRIQWYADATRNQLERWVQRRRAVPQVQQPTPLTLDDYHWPWAITQFAEHVREFNPQVIICQYVTMTYLLGALSASRRQNTLCVLDTHDILHERGLQFSTAGYLHWLEITEQQETDAWNQFDVVLTIQSQERDYIQNLTGKPEVLVVGHSTSHLSSQVMRRQEREQTTHLTIGYIGSANFSNWHAINRFLIEVWPELAQMQTPQLKLVIAGKICDWFKALAPDRQDNFLMTRVEMLGPVDELVEFYNRVDVTVNPVQFGTGLKIKNVESLAFGVPVVTTESGAVGMTASDLQHCIAVADLSGMTEKLVELLQVPDRLRQLTASLKSANSEKQDAYAEFEPFGQRLLQTTAGLSRNPRN